MSTHFEVIVGNVGSVYSGPLLRSALIHYGEYVKQSKGGYGRASGEGVTIVKNGDVWLEYVPPNAGSPEFDDDSEDNDNPRYVT